MVISYDPVHARRVRHGGGLCRAEQPHVYQMTSETEFVRVLPALQNQNTPRTRLSISSLTFALFLSVCLPLLPRAL